MTSPTATATGSDVRASRHGAAPIFIVGSARSGTTVMRFCLNQHSRIYIPFETAFFRRVYGDRRLVPERRLARHADELVGQLFRSLDPTRAEFMPLRAELAAKVAKEARSYRDVATIVFGELARRKGKVRWGEKTPAHIFYLEQILELFPDARIICMERDARAVVASWMRSRNLPTSLVLALAHYRSSARAARRHADRLLRVRYEDFVNEPAAVLRRVCAYIDEEFEPRMLTPGVNGSSYREEASFDPDLGIERDGRDRWREVLTPADARFVEWATGSSWRGATPRFILRGVRIRIRELRLRLSILKGALGFESIVRRMRRQPGARGTAR